MSTELQNVLDRFAIEALRGEFTDAGAMRDYDRLAALFVEDAVWQIPQAGIKFTSRDEIRVGIARMQGQWEFFIQNTHPGTIVVDGDTAIGRAYVAELGRFKDGTSHQNYAIYHDRYRRTEDGWRFVERSYEVRYMDVTPLPGTPDVPAFHVSG
jgi:ketosteroid isomerase-like protein